MYLKTREAAYVRKRDKSMRKAIDYGEKLAFAIREYIKMIYEIEDSKELKRQERRIDKLITKFFKYNQ